MPETFFVLLAGGVMLAAWIPRPTDVTLLWLRLGGIIALVMAGLSFFFWTRREGASTHSQAILYLLMILLILLQLAATQLSRRHLQRWAALAAFIVAVMIGTSLSLRPLQQDRAAIIISSIGIAAMMGLSLMDMLLGHAYLTASKMTLRPFKRLNNTLAMVILARIIVAVGGVLWLNSRSPIYLFWAVYGLFALTRWLVGLVVPAFFIYMARDCISRRATQSATGILYVAGVLIFIGELLALYLVRETGLPF
jgi:hypothetical protein